MTKWSAPMGLGWTKYFPLLVCGLVGLCIVSVAGHGGNIQDGDTCVPWYCSCFYRGVYYDKGDRWDSDDDPCTVFECIDNGVFLPIKSGCSFKGTCYDRNSTWAEGCFQYKCLPGSGTAYYQLHQAACVWKDGNCYLVGQRAVEHCDVYECQLDGGCYVMNKVKSGCKTKNSNAPCMPLFSFWQDECAVYQCSGEDQEKLGVRILTHSHDVMMWPRGHYALPEPKQKCPNFGEQFWVEGTHYQSGDGCNYESKVFDLLGDYNDTMYEHNFCVHHDIDDPDIIPLYQTYWEPGRYCILRYNGSCPEGFSEGFVEMYNSFSNVTNITVGVIPDGNFTENFTRMEFCCRYDGKIDRPIILPAKHPFVLFMAENETECQAVQGMNVDVEFWSFCDVDDGVNRTMNGSLPLIKTGDNNTLINFCFYHPLGCGCTDEDETVLAIGDTVTRDCVTKECTHIDRFNVMIVIEGGCYDEVNEVCRGEDVEWTDTVGEMCKNMKCVRVKNETDEVLFEVQELSRGCRDGDKCVEVNYTKTQGCYSTQCQEDPYTGDLSFVVTQAGCSRGDGVCIPDGANFTQGCVTLRCDKSKSSCGLSIVKGGCGFQGKCYDVGENFTHFCNDYLCEQYKKTYKTISWRFKQLTKRCRDQNGKCYEVGTKVNTFCATYECISGDTTVFHQTGGGCKVTVNGTDKCIDANSQLNYYCSTYNCTVYENGQRKFVLDQPGCSYGGKCYEPGDTIDDPTRCCTYRCTEAGKKQVISVGCSFKEKCYPPNKDFTDGCSTYNCFVNSTHVAIKHKSLACKVGDQCIPAGQNYTYNCHKYKCSEDVKSCKSEFLEYGCKDSNTGKCLNEGDTVFKNCNTYVCAPNGTNYPFKVSEPGCDHEGTCMEVGESISTADCKTIKCDYHQGKLSRLSLTGCKEEDGTCRAYGYAKVSKSTYYCKTYKCGSGTMYLSAIDCRAHDDSCVKVDRGESKDYKMLYGTKTCDAKCSKSTEGKLSISGIKCP